MFSVKSLGYMLNNIHFITMCTMPTFAISSQGCLVKFDEFSDAFDWFSCLNLQRSMPAINTV